jgi:predicted extracellular nuclease
VVVTAPSLLISEVNSNATGGDFFEIYNYGTTTVDLTGWKWDDDSASSTDSAAVTFPGMSIAAGQRLVVVAAANADAFNTAWSNPSGQTVALGGPGLGKEDAVVLFNASGQVMATFNYKGSAITASDGTVITTATASAGVTFVPVAHAGLAYGGSATTSAVWDGLSTSTPTYKAAVVGVDGGVSQVGDANAIGSPGQ